nr:MAG TPA: hypothetical protein [Caudoviricetes sp.]
MGILFLFLNIGYVYNMPCKESLLEHPLSRRAYCFHNIPLL